LVESAVGSVSSFWFGILLTPMHNRYLVIHGIWWFDQTWLWPLQELFLLFPRLRCVIGSEKKRHTINWETVLFDTVPVDTAFSLIQGAASLLSPTYHQLLSGSNAPKTFKTLYLDSSRILTSTEDPPVKHAIVRPVCDIVSVDMEKPVTEIGADMQKMCQTAHCYSPLSKTRRTELDLSYWYSNTVEQALLQVSTYRLIKREYSMMYLLQYRRACLAFSEALKLKLCMNPERGFSRYDRIELNKMLDFYQTQDLRKQFSEKADLLAVQNGVIQYDSSEDVIHIAKIAIEDEEDDVFSLEPLSLEPKLNTLPMLSRGPRRLWIDPATDSARYGNVADYFEEEVEHEDESDGGEGHAHEGGGNFSESGSDFGF
jgi:hypothetical protein